MGRRCVLDGIQSDTIGERAVPCPATAASQRVADSLVEAGYVGMLVRSFADGASEDDVNLVMWRWSDVYPTRVMLIDEEDRLTR